MTTITIPSLTLTAAASNAGLAYMQFARADGTIPLSLSIGSLNLILGSPDRAWSYAFAPTTYNHTGNPITQCRLRLTNGGATNIYSAWTALSNVVAGAWWITGLNITSFTYEKEVSPYVLAADVAITTAAGTFTDSVFPSIAASTDTGTDLPQHLVVAGGAPGKTIEKLKYKFAQSVTNAGAWTGTVTGTKVYKLPT